MQNTINNNKLKRQISFVALFFLIGIHVIAAQEMNKVKLKEQSTQNQKDLFRNKVKVVAHRGDWRNAPENSLAAIQNCIVMGVDMVEIDLHKTKDGTIILMHDKTLDRTSTGKGLIKELDKKSLDSLRLKNGYGMPTTDKIPTLLEALKLCKNKILVFLDKNYECLPDAVKIVKQLKMENQVFYEGKNTYSELETKFGQIIEGINYMPRVSLKSSDDTYLIPFLKQKKESIFIFSFEEKEINPMKAIIKNIKASQGKIMLTTLWDNTAGGYTDDLAVADPEANWGKVINLGADLICTDRPASLINYLKEKGFHD